MLTPSSNTVLEQVTAAMLSNLPGVSAHFSRFKVTQIALSERAERQFDEDEMLRAADLLADARVNVIAWNGTSGSWLGFDRDERLCERITKTTGIPSCTSMLALREIFERTKVRRIGLVTPYVKDIQLRIIFNLQRAGFVCNSERHCGLESNFSFADVDENSISTMVRAVSKMQCDAIAVVCTNMKAAALIEGLEAELGVPVYDSIAMTVWKSLILAGVTPDRVQGWGGPFRNSPNE
jgi:maleate isomerase